MGVLICFNKPFGVLCQFSGAHPNLADFIDQPGIYPAGRLDKDSEGLLLLTDDGRLQARISNPRFKIPKTYWAQVEGIPGDDALQALAGGILIGGRQTRPARAARIPEPEPLWARDPPVRYRRRIPDCWLTITLREGRNRQVRRMTAAVGHPCLRLVRVAVGPWRLGDLEPGAWRFDAPGALDANPAGPRRSS